MAVLKKLKEFLESNKVKYETLKHKEVYTAQEIAAAQHVPGRELAKVVMVKADGKDVMAVLPACYRIDVKKLKSAIGSKNVKLATEEEFKALFPDCDIGAMPPFGNLYNIPVIAEQVLSVDEKIVFNAGTHKDTVKMKYSDFAKLAAPKLAEFSEQWV